MLTNKLLGVIFDLDNTLVTSSLNFAAIREALGCEQGKDLLTFIDSLPAEQKREASKRLMDFEIEDALSATLLPGTEAVITLLNKLAIPCAIVTRNCLDAALIKVNNNNIDMSILLTREDHKAKPAPDALLHIAKRWNTPPENLLYVGDYLYDLQAAQNANTMSCLVTNGEIPSYANMADLVVNNLHALCEEITRTNQK